MIHKIKSLYDNGNGLSKKAIARELNVSINTVRKYLAMNEKEISNYLAAVARQKQLDPYRDFIVHLLVNFPQLSAVKVQRKLQAKYTEISLSSRSIRRYVKMLKETVASKQRRYYQPVLDMVPGEQCQVDPGELRGVLINGLETTIHFVVFVLSFSRLMYVALSPRAIDTERFIRMHDAAFRYFEGVTSECVYDQTKLVVIEEVYRELTVNQRFHEYATQVGFRIQACEGYDPESKGKVEAGVKYVKGNALYGETFDSWTDLESYMANWLDTIANQRVHATTDQVPRLYYDQHERAHMKPYLTPHNVHVNGQRLTRKADKTGLISWKANKYSVPMNYQCSQVGVDAIAHQLHVYDLETNEEIAVHILASGKGKIIKNTNHYRDPAVRIEKLEQAIQTLVGHDTGIALCTLLKRSEPKIYKDQLAGVRDQLKTHHPVATELLDKLIARPRLTATMVRDYLQAYVDHPERLQPSTEKPAQKASSGVLQCFAGIAQQEASDEYV